MGDQTRARRHGFPSGRPAGIVMTERLRLLIQDEPIKKKQGGVNPLNKSIVAVQQSSFFAL
jgi:hypothetical protein